MATIREIKGSEFEAAVARGTVLAEFGATWCSSCKMLAAVLAQAAKDAPETASIVKLDVDECQELAAKLEIGTLPTLILYKDGQIVKKTTGVQSRVKLIEMLTNA